MAAPDRQALAQPLPGPHPALSRWLGAVSRQLWPLEPSLPLDGGGSAWGRTLPRPVLPHKGARDFTSPYQALSRRETGDRGDRSKAWRAGGAPCGLGNQLTPSRGAKVHRRGLSKPQENGIRLHDPAGLGVWLDLNEMRTRAHLTSSPLVGEDSMLIGTRLADGAGLLPPVHPHPHPPPSRGRAGAVS
jgi:hypothetical protein